MKKLYIIRHAKSSWKDSMLDDFDRPLNKRGQKDAPFMGKQLAKRGVQADMIISSPAVRAKTTAQIIAKELHFTKPVVYEESIYEADVESLYQVLRSVDEKYNTVLLIGHNPGLNMLAEDLADFHENIPTCGVVEIDVDCKKFISFDYPKRYK